MTDKNKFYILSRGMISHIREFVMHDVYGRRQTAKITWDFFSFPVIFK